METRFAHLMVFVRPENIGFYRELLTFLGWSVHYEGQREGMPYLGMGDTHSIRLAFSCATHAGTNDYDKPGINHFGLAAQSVADVDATVAYLAERDIFALFDTPRYRPEFTWGENETCYQVMFESPDRILIEVVYTGPT